MSGESIVYGLDQRPGIILSTDNGNITARLFSPNPDDDAYVGDVPGYSSIAGPSPLSDTPGTAGAGTIVHPVVQWLPDEASVPNPDTQSNKDKIYYIRAAGSFSPRLFIVIERAPSVYAAVPLQPSIPTTVIGAETPLAPVTLSVAQNGFVVMGTAIGWAAITQIRRFPSAAYLGGAVWQYNATFGELSNLPVGPARIALSAHLQDIDPDRWRFILQKWNGISWDHISTLIDFDATVAGATAVQGLSKFDGTEIQVNDATEKYRVILQHTGNIATPTLDITRYLLIVNSLA